MLDASNYRWMPRFCNFLFRKLLGTAEPKSQYGWQIIALTLYSQLVSEIPNQQRVKSGSTDWHFGGVVNAMPC